MELPDFNVFIESLTDDQIAKINEPLELREFIQIENILDEKNLGAFLSHIMSQVASAILPCCLHLLAAYHEWLSENLDQC